MKRLEDFLNDNFELGVNAAFLAVGISAAAIIFLLAGNTIDAWQGVTALTLLFCAVRLKINPN